MVEKWFVPYTSPEIPDSPSLALSLQEPNQTKNGVLEPYLSWKCPILSFQNVYSLIGD